MNLRSTVALVTSVAVLSLSACSTSYQPKAYGRLSTTMDGGGLRLERDGHKFGMSAFSDDLIRAVEGNARAEEQARSYLWRARAGVGLAVGALGMIIGGASMLPNSSDSDGSRQISSARENTAQSLIIGGLLVDVIALSLMSSAQPRLLDAINIYNDGVVGP